MNSVISLVAILCIATVVSALPQKHAQDRAGHPVYAHAPPRYNYGYAVKDDHSGNNYGQTESRDGAAASGTYFVQLPDGRVQKVTYNVNGDSGYLADVTYA